MGSRGHTTPSFSAAALTPQHDVQADIKQHAADNHSISLATMMLLEHSTRVKTPDATSSFRFSRSADVKRQLFSMCGPRFDQHTQGAFATEKGIRLPDLSFFGNSLPEVAFVSASIFDRFVGSSLCTQALRDQLARVPEGWNRDQTEAVWLHLMAQVCICIGTKAEGDPESCDGGDLLRKVARTNLRSPSCCIRAHCKFATPLPHASHAREHPRTPALPALPVQQHLRAQR